MINLLFLIFSGYKYLYQGFVLQFHVSGCQVIRTKCELQVTNFVVYSMYVANQVTNVTISIELYTGNSSACPEGPSSGFSRGIRDKGFHRWIDHNQMNLVLKAPLFFHVVIQNLKIQRTTRYELEHKFEIKSIGSILNE